jgi:hypothetical protein
MPQDLPLEGLGPYRNLYPVTTPVTVLRHKAFACPNDANLYPTHPSQVLKEYHAYDSARYNQREIDGRSEACLVSRVRAHPNARQPSAASVARIIAEAEANGRGIPCLQADAVHRVVLSDTYIDACGNYYRGVKRLSFLGSQENMGTLFSAGRTSYNQGASVTDGQYDGPTYAVPYTDFVFLAELLPNDMGRITQARSAARATHKLDETGRLFLLK